MPLTTHRLVELLRGGSVDQLKLELRQEDSPKKLKQIIDYPINSGRTAVHFAAINGLSESLELLLKSGGAANAVSSRADLSQTPLHLAAKKGYARCIEILLDYGASMDVINLLRETPRSMVTGRERCEKAFEHAFAKHRIPPRTREQQRIVDALHNIVEMEGTLEQFSELYSQLPANHKDLATRWTDQTHQTLLFIATSKGLTKIVEFMLRNSRSQPLHNLGNGETPLLAACRNHLHNLAEVLLEHSPKLVFIRSATGSSPLCEACYDGDFCIVGLILQHILRLTDTDFSIEKRLSLDFVDNFGHTSLYHACDGGYFDIVKQLVSFQRENSDRVSLDFNATMKGSLRTPLHAAALSGRLDIVELLLNVEGIRINLEAYPSPKTQKKLIENFLTRVKLSSEDSSNYATVKPKDHFSMGKQGISSNKHTGKGVAALQDDFKDQAQTVEPEDKHLCVFEDPKTGKLNFNSGESFDSLLLTPLAEACAWCYIDIVNCLLFKGARDRTGLACRIAHLINRPDLVGRILSYHATVPNDLCGHASRVKGKLELKWNNLKLPICNGTWFGEEVRYFPLAKDQQGYLTLGIHALSDIHLNGNRLIEVPIELFQLESVRSINLSSNALSKLPVSRAHSSERWSLPSLLQLNLSHNRLMHLPSSVWALPSIKTLSCSANKLVTLLPSGASDDFTHLLSNSLADVDLSGNDLTTVASFFFEMPNLEKVKLNNNLISNLPDTLWGCATLSSLDLSCNRIPVLPLCLPEEYHRDSSSLPFMQLAGYEEGRVDVRVGTVSECEPLHTSSIQPLSRVRANLDNQVQQFDYSTLRKLNLSRNEFSSFPEGLACFAPNLTDLDISYNSLGKVDVHVLPVTLKRFKAKGCWITKIGNVLSKSRLKEVERNCRHSSSEGCACLHRKHTQLPQLNNLDLSDNMITDLQLIQDRAADTDEGYRITALDLLYPLLKTLDLTNNKLVGMFNPSIGRQLHLQSIKLDRNHDLEFLPMEFAYLRKGRRLTELSMKDLPNLIQPPVEYQNEKLPHLLTYMKSMLKESDYHRSVKLFFIGDGRRGKSTLLCSLMQEDKSVQLTEGIDIVTWVYPAKKRDGKTPVEFLAWDFAGQEVYHTTHQCFYSKRSMYLALFRLTDGEKGIEELEAWLMSVQIRAPGCPVIIVGTHLDQMHDTARVEELERKARRRYSDRKYPEVINVISVNCKEQKTFFFRSPIQNLRSLLYNVACHLFLGKNDTSLEYKPEMDETDPKALLQQKVPKVYLVLEERVRENVRELISKSMPPTMEHSVFVTDFVELFDDVEELMEAVHFLKLQGTLLHFDDFNLKNIFFLDPQWLAKRMADLIHPAAMGTAEHITDGVADVSGLFKQMDIDAAMKDQYLSLLEKFEIALKINDHQMIIPSLMPDQVSYPKPDDILSEDMLEEVAGYYQPPLHRFWLADFVPAGFWPRLICRVATDQHITRVLETVISSGSPSFVSPSATTSSDSEQCQMKHSSLNGSLAVDAGNVSLEQRSSKAILNWTMWQTGMAFSHKGRTLVIIKQESNEPCDDVVDTLEVKSLLLKSVYRIEIHIYTNEWVALTNELLEQSSEFIPGLATELLVTVTSHVKALTSGFFRGMLTGDQGDFESITYLPCWKCYAEIESSNTGATMDDSFICKEKSDAIVPTYQLVGAIARACERKPLQCCFHGSLEIMHMTPDLVFRDLSDDSFCDESDASLQICEDQVLGKGAFGLVCKGELQDGNGANLNVAVKFFLKNLPVDNLDDISTKELLELSKRPKNLHFAYREIRQEISFLSNLDHQNLTKLCGVRTTPYMCLLLELAKKSLRGIVDEYRDVSVVMEPLTLRSTALQIAQGLEYLHSHQAVHLDMKSPNVLVQQFPSPRDSRAVRMEQAGRVLVKIADYGISQVSTDLTMRVDVPVGTPGYIAPEMFDRPGLVISSAKVDVFAYGMVLYELMSQLFPFKDFPLPVSPNQLVCDGKRPTLKSRATRTPIQLQEVMELCWQQDPDDRPTMSEIVEWMLTPAFDQLRVKVTLQGVQSISCACMCRLLPEYEEDAEPSAEISASSDSDGIQTKEGANVFDDGEHNFKTSQAKTGADSGEMLRSGGHNLVEGGDKERRALEPCTQIWMCGRDKRKGLLELFTYIDGDPLHYHYSGYCSREEVTCICPVRNMIWMGTYKGVLKVFHGPTLKIKYTCSLDWDDSPTPVLDVLYVQELQTVLVSHSSGGVWYFNVTTVKDISQSQQRIYQCDKSPCFKMAKVVLTDVSQIQVWGTMDQHLLIMERRGDSWRLSEVEVESKDSRLKQLSKIGCATFSGTSGSVVNHIWATYRQKSVLVSFDANTREQRFIVRCDKELRNRINMPFHLTDLICTGRKVIAGTTSGHVAIYNSESSNLLNCIQLHEQRVSALLAMPKDVEPCVCAEIPFPKQENVENSSQFFAISTQMNSDPDSMLVTSVGNGKASFHAQEYEDELSDNAGKKPQKDIVLLMWST